jgi:hypothetical protein
MAKGAENPVVLWTVLDALLEFFNCFRNLSPLFQGKTGANRVLPRDGNTRTPQQWQPSCAVGWNML